MGIVFVHGRAQHDYEPNNLKSIWLQSLADGAKIAGVDFAQTISDSCSLSYYAKLFQPKPADDKSANDEENIVRGDNSLEASADKDSLILQIAIEYMFKLHSSDTASAIQHPSGQGIFGEDSSRGALNNSMTRYFTRLVDGSAPGISLGAIALVMEDVALYLTNEHSRKLVDAVISQTIADAQEPRIVVAHSLGTVAAYHVLSNIIPDVPVARLVTLGSPLGINAIVEKLESLISLPLCRPQGVQDWINASDKRDIVALNPMINRHTLFRSAAEFLAKVEANRLIVTNCPDVVNRTENHHGIIHYLDDPLVASAILQRLT